MRGFAGVWSGPACGPARSLVGRRGVLTPRDVQWPVHWAPTACQPLTSPDQSWQKPSAVGVTPKRTFGGDGTPASPGWYAMDCKLFSSPGLPPLALGAGAEREVYGDARTGRGTGRWGTKPGGNRPPRPRFRPRRFPRRVAPGSRGASGLPGVSPGALLPQELSCSPFPCALRSHLFHEAPPPGEGASSFQQRRD